MDVVLSSTAFEVVSREFEGSSDGILFALSLGSVGSYGLIQVVSFTQGVLCVLGKSLKGRYSRGLDFSLSSRSRNNRNLYLRRIGE